METTRKISFIFQRKDGIFQLGLKILCNTFGTIFFRWDLAGENSENRENRAIYSKIRKSLFIV